MGLLGNFRKFLLHITFLLLLSFPHTGKSQYQYPKDYFLFPVKPGKQNFLSGNMGELRNNHFHGGLDIRTDQQTGLPVHASADGYVSRIVVSHKGYGNTLYITHPNGLTTVYAHLEWFNYAINKHLLHYLYENELNECDYTVPKNLLDVKRGDTIAWSGNTGSSGGPHLHWEIRDENEKLLNPLFFKIPEIIDNVSPVIQKLALVSVDINSRVNGEFGRYEFTPTRLGNGNYTYPIPVHASGYIGIEMITYDKLTGLGNLCGISAIEVKADGKEIFTHSIQKIGFDENPYINRHINYKIAKERGNVFQRCYVADGNNLNTYHTNASKGIIHIADSGLHIVDIKVWDAYANYTDLQFTIQGSAKPSPNQTAYKSRYVKPAFMHEVQDNTLKIILSDPKLKLAETSAQLFIKGNPNRLMPAYVKPYEAIYLWDLRKGLPDSMVTKGGNKKSFNFVGEIDPNIPYQFYHPLADIYFPKSAAFDTLYLEMFYNYAENEWRIQQFTTPLFTPVIVSAKPPVTFDLPKDRCAAYNVMLSNGLRHAGGEWQGDHFKFKTKIFGDYAIRRDTTGPKITLFKKNKKEISLKAIDYPAGISNWKATLNGKFLLMNYEAKYNLFTSRLPTPDGVLKGAFEFRATDGSGNESVFTTEL